MPRATTPRKPGKPSLDEVYVPTRAAWRKWLMANHRRSTGIWRDAITEVQKLVTPPDLRRALDENAEAARHYEVFPPSSKRIILEWIAAAKRPETRRSRIETTVEMAAKNQRANHYRQPGGSR